MPVIVLSKTKTQVHVSLEDRTTAYQAAFRMTMSPHEWTWTQHEQECMAKFALWATQRLDAFKQLATEAQLRHEPVTPASIEAGKAVGE